MNVILNLNKVLPMLVEYNYNLWQTDGQVL
jgi:hypothetical protein